MLADEFVPVQADPRREIQVRMQRADRKAAFFRKGFEETELD
jgi:hypothetical protein